MQDNFNTTISSKSETPTDKKSQKRKRVLYKHFITSNVQRDEWLIKDYIDSVNNSLNIVPKTLPVSSKFINFNKTIMTQHTDIEIDNLIIYKSMHQMMKSLSTPEECRKYLEKVRWNGKPICPKCGSVSEKHYKIMTRGVDKGWLKCRDCRLPFSVTVGTMFEKSSIPLDKWFMAIFMFNDGKKGISSLQLERQIGVTQKSTWFMLNRIRNSVGSKMNVEFDGITQVDETFVGGKNKNRSKGKKVANTQGRNTDTKTPVFGMLSENGQVYTRVIEDTRGKTLKSIIRSKVKPGSIVVSDGWVGYKGLWWDYSHVRILHNQDIFKLGPYHTNGIEGFWSLLKRGVIGMYHFVSPKHLQLYCDEFAYRYNVRQMSPGQQFNLMLINSDERLMYKDLIA